MKFDSRTGLGIDNDTLWSIIQEDVPSLLPQLIELRRHNA